MVEQVIKVTKLRRENLRANYLKLLFLCVRIDRMLLRSVLDRPLVGMRVLQLFD